MDLLSMVALAVSVFIFALIPGPGVMSLVAHSVTGGMRQALLWAAGLVTGDLFFLLMALFGLGLVAETFGAGFMILKWLGAAYLVYLGIRYWFAAPPREEVASMPCRGSGMKNYSAGLCVSLGNPKLIAFYCGFLPGFIDLQRLNGADIVLVVLIVIPTAFTVLAGYAVMGARGGRLARRPAIWKIMHRTAAGVLISSGLAVAIRK